MAFIHHPHDISHTGLHQYCGVLSTDEHSPVAVARPFISPTLFSIMSSLVPRHVRLILHHVTYLLCLLHHPLRPIATHHYPSSPIPSPPIPSHDPPYPPYPRSPRQGLVLPPLSGASTPLLLQPSSQQAATAPYSATQPTQAPQRCPS
jgi:hypothetical protein